MKRSLNSLPDGYYLAYKKAKQATWLVVVLKLCTRRESIFRKDQTIKKDKLEVRLKAFLSRMFMCAGALDSLVCLHHKNICPQRSLFSSNYQGLSWWMGPPLWKVQSPSIAAFQGTAKERGWLKTFPMHILLFFGFQFIASHFRNSETKPKLPRTPELWDSSLSHFN